MTEPGSSKSEENPPEAEHGVKTAHENGHFYSPIVNPDALKLREDTLWPAEVKACPGIDFNDQSHVQILVEHFGDYYRDYDYPEHQVSETGFYTQNSQFSWLDSRALFVLLRALRPRRIVEIGSGFSSLLMADVNVRFLDLQTEITCVEPYPRDFLTSSLTGLNSVVVEEVQKVPLELFERLEAGDILFIDSSHVCKTGSDLNHLVFEILPRLPAGVYIHFHDIFLPQEYPKQWVLEDNRSWNEQYLLRALLMWCPALKVVFGCNYAFLKHLDLLKTALDYPDKRAWGGAVSG